MLKLGVDNFLGIKGQVKEADTYSILMHNGTAITLLTRTVILISSMKLTIQ